MYWLLPVESEYVRGQEGELEPTATEYEIESIPVLARSYPERLARWIGQIPCETVAARHAHCHEEDLIPRRIGRQVRVWKNNYNIKLEAF